jgi:hypothetical protein
VGTCRRWWVSAVLLASSLAVASCSSGTNASGVDRATTSTSGGASATDLRELVPNSLPGGLVREPDGTAGIVGPLDIDRLAASSASDRRDIEAMGFQDGYFVSYVAPDARQVNQLFLLRFRDPSGARRYLSDAYGQHAASDPPTFSSPAVPGSTGFYVSDKTPAIAVLAFAKGRFYVQSQVGLTSGRADLRSPVAALAETEYRLLP